MNKQKLIEEEEKRFAEECRKHKERIAEIQREKGSGWTPAEITVQARPRRDSLSYYLDANYCFSDLETAKKYAERIELYLRMSKWADENNGEFGREKYYIHYNSESEKAEVSLNDWFTLPMLVYFSDDDIAEKAHEKFGHEILRVWGK